MVCSVHFNLKIARPHLFLHLEMINQLKFLNEREKKKNSVEEVSMFSIRHEMGIQDGHST